MKKSLFFRYAGYWSLFPLAVSVIASGLASANTTQTQAPVSVPKTLKANYPIQNLPTAHAFLPHSATQQQEHGLAWLDDRRIMFVAALQDKEVESTGIYIWDMASNSVSQYSNHVRFCYADGYIVAFGPPKRRYDLESSELVPVSYGQMGKEKNDVCDTKTRDGCPPQVGNMSCKPREYNASPLGKNSTIMLELRSGDGAIVNTAVHKTADEGGPSTREAIKAYYDRPLILHNKNNPAGKLLPITATEEIVPWRSIYSGYSKRYVFLTSRPADGEPWHTMPWPPGSSQPIYLMTTDGTVQVIQVPSRPSWVGITLAMPSRAGVVFAGSGGHANGWGGLFLYDNREVLQLDKGRIESFAVSPNGCRVAYAIINDFGKTRNVRFNRIKSINFCDGEK